MIARSREVPASGRPPKAIAPAVGARSPASRRISVVLPHPEGPTTQRNSPLATSNEISESTGRSPKATRTFSSESMAAGLSRIPTRLSPAAAGDRGAGEPVGCVEAPLREFLGRHEEPSRPPFRSDHVLVGGVLRRAAERALEIPEASGRVIEPPRTRMSRPAARGERLPAADHLVDVANLEGDVVEMNAAVAAVQHEQVVVISNGRCTQEHRAPDVVVGDAKA